MRMPCVARSPCQACGHVRRARAKLLMGHAKCNAIGSWGRGRRTSYPNGRTPESQPLRKGHADHAPPSGETTGFRDAFWFFSKVQSSPKPRPLVPLCWSRQGIAAALRWWSDEFERSYEAWADSGFNYTLGNGLPTMGLSSIMPSKSTESKSIKQTDTTLIRLY